MCHECRTLFFNPNWDLGRTAKAKNRWEGRSAWGVDELGWTGTKHRWREVLWQRGMVFGEGTICSNLGWLKANVADPSFKVLQDCFDSKHQYDFSSCTVFRFRHPSISRDEGNVLWIEVLEQRLVWLRRPIREWQSLPHWRQICLLYTSPSPRD